jgi:hypothetical protein
LDKNTSIQLALFGSALLLLMIGVLFQQPMNPIQHPALVELTDSVDLSSTKKAEESADSESILTAPEAAPLSETAKETSF